MFKKIKKKKKMENVVLLQKGITPTSVTFELCSYE